MNGKWFLAKYWPYWTWYILFKIKNIFNFESIPKTQLQMCLEIQKFESKGIILPDGYTIQSFNKEKDLDSWVELLKICGFSQTDRNTFTAEYSPGKKIEVYSIAYQSTVVSTAGACHYTRFREKSAIINFVAVAPEHRGQRLGEMCLVQVIIHLKELGFKRLFLMTDDHRIPAIKVYLRLGFLPCLSTWDHSHRARWKRVLKQTQYTHIKPCTVLHAKAD